ncbi:hypothetical protein DBR45_31850 [Pseudomonas sp. HMWF031]|nr:hypothetical protein DBR45_31850 [Pseudomonas sp. HMWF031]
MGDISSSLIRLLSKKVSQFDTSETLVEEADYRQCSASDISSRGLNNVESAFLIWPFAGGDREGAGVVRADENRADFMGPMCV